GGAVPVSPSSYAAQQFGQNYLLRRFENTVLRNTGFLDVVEVEAGPTGFESVSTGKYLFSELYVNYTRKGFSSSGVSSNDVSLEYWVSRNVLLRGELGLGVAQTPTPDTPTTTTTSSRT